MRKRTLRFLVYGLQAIVLTFVLSGITYTDFARFRKKVISGVFVPTEHVLTVDFEGPSGIPVGPLLFGAKVGNRENKSKVIQVVLNLKSRGNIRLKPKKTAEYFLDLDEKYLRPRNRIEFEGSDNQWELRDLEIRNFYGYSKGLLNFIIIPKAAKIHPGLPTLYLPAIVILLFLLGWLSGAVGPRKLAAGPLSLALSLSAFIVLAFAAFLPAISKYKALFSPGSFWLILPWLYAGISLGFLRAAYDWGRERTVQGLKIFQKAVKNIYLWGRMKTADGLKIFQEAVGKHPHRNRLLVTIFVPLAICLFFLNIMIHTLNFYQGDYSKFVCFAERFASDNNPIFWDTSAELLFPNSDFEKGTLENWTPTGNAFLAQPNKSENVSATKVSLPVICQGRYWIGSIDQSRGKKPDKEGGTLTSISFTIKKNKIGFLISGGNPKMAKGIVRKSLALEVDGAIVCEDTGKNDNLMEHRVWEVRQWVGKEARILIIDENSQVSYFRHINVDWLHYHEQERMDLIKNGLFKRKGGYDGQFYYFIAYDPFLSRFRDNPLKYRYMVDEPAYRFGRIGFPLLIKLFSFDRPEIYPQTMIGLILLSYFIGAFFLLKIVQFFKQSPLWTFLYILIPGFQLSLQRACPEPISLALLLAGLYFYLKQKIPLASLLFAGSILIRETVVVFILAVILYELFKKKNVKNALLLVTATLPYFSWKIFLTLRLFSCYGWRTLFFRPNIFGLPFSGLIELFKRIIAGQYYKDLTSAALAYPIILIAVILFSLYFIWKRIDALTLGLVFFSLLSLLFNYAQVWVNVNGGLRLTQEVLVFLILVFVSQKDQLKPATRNIFLGFFGFVFLFDYFFLPVHHFFRAGFFLK